MPPSILIVDDEPKIGDLLRRSLERDAYTVTSLTSPGQAIELLKGGGFDVLLTDLRMPGMDGIEVLTRSKQVSPSTEVILMTAFATVDTAREALKRGAVDYLVKPVSAEEDLKPLLRRLLADASEAPVASRPSSPGPSPSAPRLASKSPAMLEVLGKLERVARSGASVLIRGESGTGKEVLADALQSLSPRAKHPYVKVNCGALPENLLESELFGHVKGSFTGATSDRAGLFETADKGTIFLDEIGEVSPALQVKLLRVLQGGDFNRVGDSKGRKVDVRVVAATNRNLEHMIQRGEFRQDLYYRLNVVPLTLPALRERRDDMPDLIESFCRRFAGGTPVMFSTEAMAALLQYEWPGNIRELENAIEHALVLGDPSGIGVADLPAALQDEERKRHSAATERAVGAATLEEIEQRCLMTALGKTRGNRTRAAHLLGITRRTLGYRLRKYGLEGKADELSAE